MKAWITLVGFLTLAASADIPKRDPVYDPLVPPAPRPALRPIAPPTEGYGAPADQNFARIPEPPVGAFVPNLPEYGDRAGDPGEAVQFFILLLGINVSH